MRVIAGLLVMWSASSAQPVRETFAAPPDLKVVVSYASDQHASELQILPAQKGAFIPEDLLDRVLDQIIPPATRGIAGLDLYEAMSRASCHTTDYEYVSVSRSMTDSHITDAHVRFKSLSVRRDAGFFRALYGQPIAEGFTPRPDVMMTISYSPGRQRCALDIRPVSDAPFVPDEVLDAVLEEAVPPSTRGEKLNEMATMNGHAGQSFTEYEFVSITRVLHMPGLVRTSLLDGATAVVKYKANECDASQ